MPRPYFLLYELYKLYKLSTLYTLYTTRQANSATPFGIALLRISQ